jgi:hypothetical protein
VAKVLPGDHEDVSAFVLGAGAAALALALHVSPGPRRPVRLEWSLACFGAAAVTVVAAISMCGLWSAWQGACVLLMGAVTLALVGFWLAEAPLPGEPADRAERRLVTDAASWRTPSLPIDWDAFDRVREQWSRTRESDRR